MKTVFSFVAALLLSFSLAAQESEPLIPPGEPLTWLGIDFTQMRFLGYAPPAGDTGGITTETVRDKYAPAWNQLFVDEMKKYDVAKYTRASNVEYALEVTGKANKSISGELYSTNDSDYVRLKESDIEQLVRRYDYLGRKGVGLMFFVEGINKSKQEAAAWITVVDMDRRALIGTRRATAKAGGFGFRNYWASSFLGILRKAGQKANQP